MERDRVNKGSEREGEREESPGFTRIGIVTRLPRFDPRGRAKSNERRRHDGGEGFLPGFGRGEKQEGRRNRRTEVMVFFRNATPTVRTA